MNDFNGNKAKPVYFNSNEYLGGEVGQSDSDKLPSEDFHSGILEAERLLLKTLIRFAPARIALSTSLRHSSNSFEWSSPERLWLFTQLVEGELMLEGDQLRKHFLAQDGVPENAFLRKKEKQERNGKPTIADENETKPCFNNVIDLSPLQQMDYFSMESATKTPDKKDIIPDNYDPSEFGDSFIENDQISLSDLEVIYDKTPIESSLIDDKTFPDEHYEDQRGVLDDLFAPSNNEEEELDALDPKGLRAELIIQETLTYLLRGTAFLEKNKSLSNLNHALLTDPDMKNMPNISALHDEYKIRTQKAIDLDNSSQRINSRILDVSVGSKGLKNAKAQHFDEFFATMDEFLAELPDDDQSKGEFQDEEEKGIPENIRQEKEANESYSPVDDDFEVDDFLAGWSNVMQ